MVGTNQGVRADGRRGVVVEVGRNSSIANEQWGKMPQ
jgi:hypothetical protein